MDVALLCVRLFCSICVAPPPRPPSASNNLLCRGLARHFCPLFPPLALQTGTRCWLGLDIVPRCKGVDSCNLQIQTKNRPSFDEQRRELSARDWDRRRRKSQARAMPKPSQHQRSSRHHHHQHHHQHAPASSRTKPTNDPRHSSMSPHAAAPQTARPTPPLPPPPRTPPTKQRESGYNGHSWLIAPDPEPAVERHSTPRPLASSNTSSRESLVSIVDDPFFLRYDPAFSPSAEAGQRSSAAKAQTDSDENDLKQSWPPPRRESLTVGPSLVTVRTPPCALRLSLMTVIMAALQPHQHHSRIMTASFHPAYILKPDDSGI